MRYRPCLVALLFIGSLLPFMGCEAPASLSSIQINPSTQTIAAGGTTQFTAIGTYTHGTHPAETEDITSQVTWASSTAGVATIASSGLATGVGAGTTNITASAAGFTGQISGSATLTVTGQTKSSSQDVVSIVVTPAAPTVSSLNETTQFIAIGTTNGGASVNLTASSAWSSSDVKVATVSTSGLATGLSSGTSTITAIFTNPDGSVANGSATFKVAPAAVQEPLISLTIVPAAQTALAVNQTAQFIAIGTTSSGTSVNLTAAAVWSSSNSAVATIAAGGLATAHSSGTAAITAIASNPDGTVVSGSAALTVNIPANSEPLVSLSIMPAAQTAQSVNETIQYIAIGTTGTGATVNLTGSATWGSSDAKVATIGAATGLATALASGTTAITAIASNPDGTVVSGTASLTVNIAATKEPLVSLSVVPAAQTILAANQTAQFIAIGTTSAGTTVNLTTQSTWTSSSPAVASVNAATGVAKALTSGTTAITAIATNPDGSVVSGSAALTVNIPANTEPYVSLSIIPAAQAVLAANQSAQFLALATTGTGATVNVTNQASWYSSVPAVATVNPATGVTLALTSGSAAITAVLTNPDGTAVSGSAALTVTIPTTPEPLVSMTVLPVTQTAQSVGETVQYIAIGTTGTGATVNLTSKATWSSSDGTVASIGSATGLAKALASGTTAISAIATNPDGTVVTGNAVLTVNISAIAEPLVSVSIVPAAETLVSGQTAQFIAIGTTSSGASVNLTNPTTLSGKSFTPVWGSSNVAVATMSATTPGLATAIGAGATAITVVVTNPDGTAVSGSAALTVTAASEPLVSLAILPTAQTVTALTQTVSYVAIGTTASGATVDLTNQTATLNGVAYSAALWSSSVPTVAAIDPNTGKASPLANGSTAIVARVTNKSDGTVVTASVALTVNLSAIQEPLLSMAIVPGSQSVAAVGQTSQFLAIGDFSSTSSTPGYQNMAGVTTYKVAWSSSNPNIATIDATGKVTAVGVGSIAITALATNTTDNSGVVATAAFSVLGPAPEPISTMSIFPATQAVTLPPANGAPQTAQFIAIGTNGSTGLQTDVSSQVAWTSTNPLVATVSATGLATALSQGTTIINAVAHNADKSVVTATATLTVNPAAAEPLLSIAILPGAQTLEAKQSSSLIAIGSYSTSPATQVITGSVTWASSNVAVASITSGGVVKGVAPGTAVITAIGLNPDGSQVAGTATVTVTAASEPLLSMSIQPGTDSVAAVGQTSQLLAIGDFSSTASAPGFQNMATVSGYTLVWYSSNTQVATVDANGKVTAVGIGSAAITATATSAADNSGATASATFTVNGPPAEQISTLSIFPGSQTVSLAQPGATLNTIGYIALGTNGTTGLVSNVSGLVSWSSTNPLVATITSGGVATLLTAGTTTITATVTNTKDGSVVTATATLTVTASVEPLLSLAIIPANQSIGTPGVTAQYYAIGTTSSGATVDLTTKSAVINGVTYSAALWSSSIPGVGTIGAATGTATPVGIGTTAIVARVTNASDGSTVAAAATFTSNIPLEPIVSVAVVPGTQTVGTLNQTIVYRAIGTTAAGTTVDLTNLGFSTTSGLVSAAAWTSSVSAVASMNQDPVSKKPTNVATALANGVTAIVATVTNPDGSTVTGSSLLTVAASPTPEPLTSIAIVPATETAQAGQTAQFIAVGTTSTGATVNLTNSTTISGNKYTPVWASSNISVATMSAATSGLANAVGPGVTAITVGVTNPDGTSVTGSAVLTVTSTSEPLVSLAVFPAAQTASSLNQQVQFIAIGTTATGTTVNLTNQTATLNGNKIAAAQWSSSTAAVASIDPALGAAVALTNGVTVITAIAANPDGTVVTGSTTLTVAIPANKEPLVSIAVVPAAQTLLSVNQQAQFVAIGTTASGATVNLTGKSYTPPGSSTPILAAQWTSSSSSVASIDPNTGIAKAVANGAAAITAVAYNPDGTAVSGSAVLTVTASTAEPLVSLTVSPTSQTATSINQPIAFIAIGTTASGATVNLTNQSYTPSGSSTAIAAAQWNSSGTTVANFLTPASPNVVTALGNGATAITAIVTNPDGTVVTGSTALTVAISATPEPLISLAIVPGTQSVAGAGQTAQFLAIGDFTATSTTPGFQNMANASVAANYTVTWNSSNPNVATIDQTGLVTAKGVGTTAITALSTFTGGDKSGVLATAAFSVTGPAANQISSLSIFPGSQSLTLPPVGSASPTASFVVIGTNVSSGLQTNVTGSVTWTSSNPQVSLVPDGTGSVTALGAGTTTLTASYLNPANGGVAANVVTATATLTVTGPASEQLLSVAILPGNQTLEAKQSSSLIAIGSYSTGLASRVITGSVTWATSNTSVASITAGGVVLGVAPGTAVVTAIGKNPDGSVVTGTATVTVVAASEPLLSLTIAPGSQSVAAVGETADFLAIGDFTPVSGSTLSGFQNMANVSTYTTVWYSSNASVATIDQTGTVTATGQGTTAISAISTSKADGSASTAAATFTVVGPNTAEITTLAILPGAQTVTLPTVGSAVTANFVAIGSNSVTGLSQDLTNAVTWSSSVPSVATISTSGATAGQVTAVGAGTTTITAEYTNPAVGSTPANVVTATATFTVNGAASEPLLSLAILPGSQTVSYPSQSAVFTAIGTFSSAPFTQNLTNGTTANSIQWISSDPSVATVGSPEKVGTTPGLVTAVGQGTTAITAIAKNTDGTLVTGAASFTVQNGTAEPITALSIVPGGLSLSATGQQGQYLALGTSGLTGLVEDVTNSPQLKWSSSIPTIATISTYPTSPAGVAMGVSPGSSIITAQWTNPATATVPANEVTATSTVTITASPASEPLLSISVVPASITIWNLEGTGQYLAYGTFSTAPTVMDITNGFNRTDPVTKITTFTPVTWVSPLPEIFPVDSAGAGGSTGGLVTAIGSGTGVIYATATNPDSTVVMSPAVSFNCPFVPYTPAIPATATTAYVPAVLGSCNEETIAQPLLVTLTIFNAGLNTNGWLVTASSATGTPDVIHCGGSEEAASAGGSVCVATYPVNSTVLLTAPAYTGSGTVPQFGGWSFNCTPSDQFGNPIAAPYWTAAGPNYCTIDLGATGSSNQSVGAIFN
jgi:uncharacterized protein YjdB/uncharacterized protein YcfL